MWGWDNECKKETWKNDEREKKADTLLKNKLEGGTGCIRENHLVLRAQLFRLVDALKRVISETRSGANKDSPTHDKDKDKTIARGLAAMRRGVKAAGGQLRCLQNAILAAALVNDSSFAAPNFVYDAELVHGRWRVTKGRHLDTEPDAGRWSRRSRRGAVHDHKVESSGWDEM